MTDFSTFSYIPQLLVKLPIYTPEALNRYLFLRTDHFREYTSGYLLSYLNKAVHTIVTFMNIGRKANKANLRKPIH